MKPKLQAGAASTVQNTHDQISFFQTFF